MLAACPRIYVECLEDTNAYAHGQWIEVTTLDVVEGAIQQILAECRKPTVIRRKTKCPTCTTISYRTLSTYDRIGIAGASEDPGECDTCKNDGTVQYLRWDGEPYPSADRWIVYDYCEFGAAHLGEHPNLASLVELADLIRRHGTRAGDLYEAMDESIELTSIALLDCYEGEFASLEAYGRNFLRQSSFFNSLWRPEALEKCVDFKQYAKTLIETGDKIVIEQDGRILVFHSPCR